MALPFFIHRKLVCTGCLGRVAMQKTKLFSLLKSLLSHNFRTLFLFEVFYKMFAYGFFTPLLIWLAEVSIDMAGLHYLSGSNVGEWMKSPYTWLTLFVVMLLLCAYVLVDMAAVIICMDCAKRGEYVSGITLLWESIKSVVRLFHWRNLCMILYVLILLPILSLPFFTGYVTSIKLPEFLNDTIGRALRAYWPLLLLSAAVVIVAFRYVYAVFYYVLEKKNFLKSCLSSHYLIYRVYTKDLLRLFLWQITGYLVYSILIAVVIALVIGISSLFGSGGFVHAVMISLIEWIIDAVQVLFSCMVVPLSTMFLSLMFYQNKELIGEPVQQVTYKSRLHSFSRKKKRIIMAVSCLFLVILNLNNIKQLTDGVLRDSAQIAYETKITAHRGASADYPENTMPAFEAAIDYGADWLEIDVQQTADGVLIVMHDSNLYRTTGVDRDIWEASYDEIKDLDAGSYMGEEFCDVRISTLEEVLELCKGRINLNIELKPTGHETDLVKQVVDLIYEYEMADDCMLASMSYGALVEAKEYAPDIRTIYVMKTVYGYFADLEDVDVFSIKNTYITERIVESVHLEGKLICAWTVNSLRTMEKMIDMGVDNLITDQPLRARQKVFEMENSTIINEYVQMLLSLFY